MPDQLVNLDMKHGVEAKNYEEVSVWDWTGFLDLVERSIHYLQLRFQQSRIILNDLVNLKAKPVFRLHQ